MRMDLSGLTATAALPVLPAGEMVALCRRSDVLLPLVSATAGGTLTNWQRCRMAMSEEDIKYD